MAMSEWGVRRVARRAAGITLVALALAGCRSSIAPAETIAPVTPLAAGVVDLLPAASLGEPLVYQRGPWNLVLASRPDELLDAIAKAGFDPDNLRVAVAFARTPTPERELMIAAWTVPGMDVGILREAQIDTWRFAGETRWPETVAGRAVVRAGPAALDRARDPYFLVLDEAAVMIVSDDRAAVEDVVANLPP